MSAELVEAALAWHDGGFCVLPAAADGSKRVALGRWKQYETERPTATQVADWAASAEGIGLLMGATSGYAEMLEVEGKAVELVPAFLEAVGTASQKLLRKLLTYIEVTPSGGYHWIYRVLGAVAGNTKLASRPAVTEDGKPARDTLIETRGEGGWVVVAPSGGRVHATGKAWATTSSYGVVATLSPEERDLLHSIARTFDEMPEVVIEHREALPTVAGELTPGQDYAARTSWAEILKPEGWTLVGRHGDKLLWTRPGKDAHHGPSATTNYDGNDNLYVFSSSTVFEPMASYTKFAAYAVLHHGGDYKEAARALRREGYGSAQKQSTAQAESRATLSLIQGGATTATSGANALAPEDSSSPAVSSYDYTDLGNATRFAAVESPRLRYSPERDAWLAWSGGRWHWLHKDGAAVEAMKALVLALPDDDKAAYSHKLKSMSEPAIRKAVRLARSDPSIEVAMSSFDAQPYELNTPTGVVDLRTGELMAATPEGLHTRVTGVGVDPSLPCPRWMQFLADTFPEDPAIIEFVQRVAGYSATGRVTHHVLPFLHGSGGNGKSVFIDVLMRVLGQYASSAPADFLLLGGREDESATARLSGLRLVVCSEVGPAAKFNEQKVKLLTGGDQITARFLFQNHFTFTPTHHLWLMGNHQPQVDAGGESFWRRLRLVPFTRTVPEEKKIVGLADVLVEEEGPAILAWIIEGARKQLHGLAEPESVRVATRAYAEEEDHLGQFIEERIRFGGGDYVRLATGDVRHVYEQWCFAEGEKPMPANVFGRELKARGAGTTKSHGRRFYTNVTLMKPEDKLVPSAEQLRYGD